MFKLSNNSLKKLEGVHPKLFELCLEAIKITPIDFGIVQGVRTKAMQAALFAQGRDPLNDVNALRKAVGWGPITAKENQKTVTNTLNSNHLEKPDGYGHAIDFGAFLNGVYQNGDTKEEQALYGPIADAFKVTAKRLGIKIECGIDWPQKDYGHVEIKI